MILPSLEKLRSYTPFLAIFLIILGFFWKLVFTNLILARGDILFYLYPYWDYRAQALLEGEIPLWNPYLFMGAPFLANPQTAVLYPLNWPLALFPVYRAVKIAVLVHTLIAGIGTYCLARRAAWLTPRASTLAALLFALGGHMTAKVEQVNQLQALAWLPWLLLVANQFVISNRSRHRFGLAFSIIFAMQFLAGHTQTTFISLIGIVLWSILTIASERPATYSRKFLRNLRVFGLSFLGRFAPLIPYLCLALMLTGAQLLPTIELSQHSLRSGGLPFQEAVSFSLHPLLFGRALLPSYSRALSNEFVAYIGVIGLLLALLGASRRSTGMLPVLCLACLGLFFALGRYNPIYSALVNIVPGFNLFRVPARWLALWGIGAALLAGKGYDRLHNLLTNKTPRLSWAGCVLITGLITLAFISSRLTPPGETGNIGVPTWQDIAGWLLALVLGLTIIVAFRPARYAIILAATIELFLASLQLPLNNLTSPHTYTSVRPAMTQLISTKEDTAPAARFISMSNLLFEPGDIIELRSLHDELPSRAARDAVVAAKAKEVLSPNLALAWGLPSVDGYGGGLLPLARYAQFATQFTGTELPSFDGRLREDLKHTPPDWLLTITSTRWLIADKLHDAWHENVFYDLQFDVHLGKGDQTKVQKVRVLQATAVGMILSADDQDSELVGEVHIDLDDGTSITRPVLTHGAARTLVHVDLGIPITPTAIRVKSRINRLTIHAMTLIDERSGAFQPQTLGDYRLAHSGDVKVYEKLQIFPRAYLVRVLPITPNTLTTGRTHIREYTSNRIVIDTESDAAATLVLADAHFPGWKATVDGQPTEIRLANGFFRAIDVPAGPHHVVFHYQPGSWKLGLYITGVSLPLWIALCFWSFLPKRHQPAQ